MKNLKLVTLLGVFLFVFATVSLAMDNVNTPGKVNSPGTPGTPGTPSTPQDYKINVIIEWAAFDKDHAAVDYVVEGLFNVPAGYLPVNCPVNKTKIFDANGHDVSGIVFTACRVTGENRYSVTQFFYNDFRELLPELLEISIGENDLMPVGDGEIVQLPLIGTYSFNAHFKRLDNIAAHPNQVKQKNGVSLAVNRVDFTPKMIKVDAYLSFPDNRDWIPEAYILLGGNQIHVDEWFIPNYKEHPETFDRSKRFYTFLIYNDIKDFRQMKAGMISFGVREVYANMPEAVDKKGLEKIKKQLEKQGLNPQLNQYGYYPFITDINDSKIGEKAKADLFEYIEKVMTERRTGPLEVKIR